MVIGSPQWSTLRGTALLAITVMLSVLSQSSEHSIRHRHACDPVPVGGGR